MPYLLVSFCVTHCNFSCLINIKLLSTNSLTLCSHTKISLKIAHRRKKSSAHLSIKPGRIRQCCWPSTASLWSQCHIMCNRIYSEALLIPSKVLCKSWKRRICKCVYIFCLVGFVFVFAVVKQQILGWGYSSKSCAAVTAAYIPNWQAGRWMNAASNP